MDIVFYIEQLILKQIKIVKILLNNGADVNLINNNGQTVFMLALTKNYKPLIKCLTNYNSIPILNTVTTFALQANSEKGASKVY